MVDDTAATLIPPIPCVLTRTLYSSTDMNSRKSKAALIDKNNQSSAIGCNCMEYKHQFRLESEYCDRIELNGSG